MKYTEWQNKLFQAAAAASGDKQKELLVHEAMRKVDLMISQIENITRYTVLAVQVNEETLPQRVERIKDNLSNQGLPVDCLLQSGAKQ